MIAAPTVISLDDGPDLRRLGNALQTQEAACLSELAGSARVT